MATIGEVKRGYWPFTYKNWKITYLATVERNPHDGSPMVLWGVPVVLHLHTFDKQNVRWTKRRKKIDVNNLQDWYAEGEEEQLCCFVCAEYMPDAVYEYFERCKEMVKCSLC